MRSISLLLFDLSTPSSVCCTVLATANCHGVLTSLCNSGWRALYPSLKGQLGQFDGQQQFSPVLNYYHNHPEMVLCASFWPFVRYLLDNSMKAFPSDVPALTKWRDDSAPLDLRNVEESQRYRTAGCLYPNRPLWRPRRMYTGLSQERHCECRHAFPGHRKKTGGVMAIFCDHEICQGCHIINHAEGRKDAFYMLFCRFERAPRVVIYDFACNLAGDPPDG